MQVTTDESVGLKKSLTITFPAHDYDSKYHQRLNELVKVVRLDGFRPGKINKNFLIQKHGEQIKSEVLNDLIEQSWKKASEEHLTPETPLIPQSLICDIQQCDLGKDLILKFQFEVQPDFQILSLKELGMKFFDYPEITDEAIELARKAISYEKGHEEENLEVVESGSRVFVEIDVISSAQEERKPQFKNEVVTFVEGLTRQDFYNNLKGTKVGDEVSFESSLTDLEADLFPGESVEEPSTPVKMVVRIKEIKKIKPLNDDELLASLSEKNNPSSDDEADLSSADQEPIVVKTLTEYLKEYVENHAHDQVCDLNKNAFLKKVTECYTFDMPQTYLDIYASSPENQKEGIDSIRIALVIQKLYDSLDIPASDKHYINQLDQHYAQLPANKKNDIYARLLLSLTAQRKTDAVCQALFSKEALQKSDLELPVRYIDLMRSVVVGF